eukprot:315344_1
MAERIEHLLNQIYFPGSTYPSYKDKIVYQESDKYRYISIQNRCDKSSIPLDRYDAIQGQKKKNVFKSAVMLKDPFDEQLLRSVVYEIKPKTIFEFGTFTGGSADYMAMLLSEYKFNDSKIITFDKYPEFKDQRIPNNKFIEWVIFDLYDDFKKNKELNGLNKYEHPWLIIEDSHIDITRILNYFDSNGMKCNDYIIIEDTYMEYGKVSKKMTALRNWLIQNEHKGYLVDSKYCDFWGYNATWNVNGYIKKLK